MTRTQAAAVGLFVAGFLITVWVFALAFWCFDLPWGAALCAGAAGGLYAIFAIWPGQQSSEPDASGSVDRSVTTVVPVTSGVLSEAKGSAGGGVEVESREVTRG